MNWEERVLATPGAAERVAEIEEELRTSNSLAPLIANLQRWYDERRD